MKISTLTQNQNGKQLLNFDFPGNDLGIFTATTYDQCDFKCNESIECIGFVTSSAQECWLKSKFEFGQVATDRNVQYKEDPVSVFASTKYYSY